MSTRWSSPEKRRIRKSPSPTSSTVVTFVGTNNTLVLSPRTLNYKVTPPLCVVKTSVGQPFTIKVPTWTRVPRVLLVTMVHESSSSHCPLVFSDRTSVKYFQLWATYSFSVGTFFFKVFFHCRSYFRYLVLIHWETRNEYRSLSSFTFIFH